MLDRHLWKTSWEASNACHTPCDCLHVGDDQVLQDGRVREVIAAKITGLSGRVQAWYANLKDFAKDH